MARRRKGLNRHQKAAFKGGEQRVRGETIDFLIEMAASTEPDERLHAAENLCPATCADGLRRLGRRSTG
jgi:hypothetical protein